jgi:hypothetical protein
MEIRKRKKKAIADILCDAIVPFGGCVFVIFLVALLCLLTSLGSTGEPGMRMRTTTTSGSAEDAQYQLNNRQIYHQSSSNSGIRDPGSMDKNLTRLE